MRKRNRMKKRNRFALSLLACLFGASTVAIEAASAESRTVYVPFTAIVSESCHTPVIISDAALGSQPSCSVQQEAANVVESAKEGQRLAETTHSVEEISEETVVRVTVVGK